MDDSELETRLRRYRPAGPPAGLRERIVAPQRGRVWPWVGAAAALLISTQMLTFASRHELASASEALGPSAVVRMADDLTERLGGDAPARALAELIMFEQQMYAEPLISSEPGLAGEEERR
jgi:hypothetical protein